MPVGGPYFDFKLLYGTFQGASMVVRVIPKKEAEALEAPGPYNKICNSTLRQQGLGVAATSAPFIATP